MYIKQVQLEHFKRHQSLEVNLSRGVNAICGPNGAGKSSIIEAIGFALFNACDYSARTELVRKGAKRAKVLVEFESPVDQQLYLVERHISTSSANRYIVRDSRTASVMAEKTGDCLELLPQLMGAEGAGKLSALFTDILGVPQGTITAAFHQNNSARKATFAPLLRVEEYEKASFAMKGSFLDPLQTAHQTHAAAIALTRHELETLPEKAQEHDLLVGKVAQAEAELTTLSEQIPAAEAERNALQAQRTKLDSSQQQLQASTHTLKELDQRLQRTNVELVEAQKAQEIVTAAKADHNAFLEVKPKLASLQATYQNLQQQRNALQQLTLQQHHQQLTYNQLQEQCSALEAQEKELIALAPKVAEHEKASRALERLLQQLTGLTYHREKMADLRLEGNSLRAEEAALLREREALAPYEGAQERLMRVREEGIDLAAKRAALVKEEEERIALEQKLHQLQSQSQETRARLELTQKEETELRRELQPLASRLDEHDRALHQMRQQLDQLSARRERDAAFQKRVSGGICPYFEQSCKNVPPGQRLDHFLQANIQRSDQEARTIEKQAKEAEAARERAHKALRRLDHEVPKFQGRAETERREIERLAQQERDHRQERAQMSPKEAAIKAADEALVALRVTFKKLQDHAVEENKLPATKLSLVRLEQVITTHRADTERYTKELAKLEALEPELPPLRKQVQSLTKDVEHHRDLSRATKQLPALQEKRKSCAEALATTNAKLAEKQKQVEALTPEVDEREALATQLQEVEPGYTRYIQHIQVAAKLAERQEERAKLQQRHDDASRERTALEESIATLQTSFSLEKLQKVEASLRQLLHRNGELRGQLPGNRERRDQLAATLEDLRAREQALRAQEVTHAANEGMLVCSKLLRNVIKDAAPHMTRVLIGSISAEADRLFQHLLDQNNLHLRWDETFALLVEEEGQERSFANLSGGEQMAAALAVRIAMIKELSSIRLAFFDEPTAHLDSNRRYNLASQLTQIEGFDQLLVISHDDTFETMTNHVVWLSDT